MKPIITLSEYYDLLNNPIKWCEESKTFETWKANIQYKRRMAMYAEESEEHSELFRQFSRYFGSHKDLAIPLPDKPV